MIPSKRLGRQPERRGREATGRRQSETPFGARDYLHEDVRAGIAHLTAITTAFRLDISEDERELLREATSCLEQLRRTLSRSPMRHRKRAPFLELASPNALLPQKLTEMGEAERKLAATIASVGPRLIKDAADDERSATRSARDFRDARGVRERFESAFGSAPIGMALIDVNENWIEVNRAFCSITGYSADELTVSSLQTITHPDDHEVEAEDRARLIAGEISSYHREKRYRHAAGHDIWVLVTASMVRDEKGQALYLIKQVQDISERKELAEHLEYLVDHDVLTGLFNRRRFEQELARETGRATRYGQQGAVLLIDVDHFKDVNDTFGHAAGDELLRAVAGTLKQRLRDSDILSRLGGDEFAVLLPGATAARAERVADDIVTALNRKMAVLVDRSAHVTASVGVSLFDGRSDVDVLASADLAMYEAKEAGRNRFAIHQPRANGPRVGTATLVQAGEIRHALDNGRLLLFSQPILDLESDQVTSHELLLRLPGEPGEEPISPGPFLHAAERSGLIQSIDMWVVRKAISLAMEHDRAGLRLPLHINVSGRTIGDPRFVAFTEQLLTDSGIDPSLLVFELTETAAVANLEEASLFTTRLRSRGCGLALDDFGAGFGTFSYIKKFPFDYLKIDGAFIRSIATSTTDRLVVQAVVNIAKGLGKKTIAEFVGDAEAMGPLRSLGVDYAQGYQIGRPRPVSELLTAQ